MARRSIPNPRNRPRDKDELFKPSRITHEMCPAQAYRRSSLSDAGSSVVHVRRISWPNAPASRARVRGAVVGDEAMQDWEDSSASAERIYAYCALTASGCDRGDAS